MIGELQAALASLAQRLDAHWLPVLLLVMLGHYFAEPARWRIYLRHHPAAQWPALFHVFSLTAFVGYVVPAKLGLPLRIFLLRRRIGLPLGEVAALLGVDGAATYLTWALASVAALPWAAGIGSTTSSRLLLGTATILAFALVMGLSFRALPAMLRGCGSAAGRLSRCLSSVLDAVRSAASRRVLAAAAGITAIDILGHTLRHWILLVMIGHPLPLPVAFAAACIGIFAGMASLMPMGLGGYDITLVLILGLNGVPVADGVAIALANRLANLAVASPLGLWSGTVLGINAFDRRALRKLGSGG